MYDESVVCICGYRLKMTKGQFREASTGAVGTVWCPKCNKELNKLIVDLQKAMDGGVSGTGSN